MVFGTKGYVIAGILSSYNIINFYSTTSLKVTAGCPNTFSLVCFTLPVSLFVSVRASRPPTHIPLINISGGTMPSFDTFFYFQKDLHLLNAWYISGVHYQKTSEAWLARLDSNRDRILPFLEVGYGSKEAAHVWLNRWVRDIFFLIKA